MSQRCYINDPTVYRPGCLFLHCRLGLVRSKAHDHQSQILTYNCFKNRPCKQIFSHLKSACFAYPVKLHGAAVTHWWDRARGCKTSGHSGSARHTLWPRDWGICMGKALGTPSLGNPFAILPFCDLPNNGEWKIILKDLFWHSSKWTQINKIPRGFWRESRSMEAWSSL